MPLDAIPSQEPLSAAGNQPLREPEPHPEPVPASPPPALSAPLSMESLLAVFGQHWVLMLIAGALAGAAGAAAGWFLTPGMYTTIAVIQLPKIKGINDGEGEQLNFQRAAAALIKSSSVLDKVIADPEVAGLREIRQHSEPVAWLEKDLVTDNNQLGVDMLRISLSGDYPEDLPIILNKVLQVYGKEFDLGEDNRTRARREQLKQKYKSISDDLRKERPRLRKLEQTAGVEDSETRSLKQTALLSALSGLETNRMAVRQSLIKAKSELTNAEAQLKAPGTIQVPVYLVDRELRADARMARRNEEMIELEKKYQDILKATGVNSSGAQEVRDRQEAIRQTIVEYRRKIEAALREQAGEEMKEGLVKNKALIAQLNEQEGYLDQQVQVKQAELLKLKTPTLNDAAVALGVSEARDDVARMELMLKRLGEEMGAQEAESALKAQLVVIEYAQAPTGRRVDRKLRMAGLGGLGLFGVAALGVALAEFGKRRVYGPDDVAHGLGINLLGTLPTLSAQARQSIPLGNNQAPARPDHLAMLEAIDALRTVLLYSARSKQFRTIMVTSPEVGEGKTTLACQLASSLARSGRKTLLLDLDLRDPSAHLAFDLPLAPGFSEVLRGEAALESVLCPTAIEGLSVVPAGQADRLAIQSLTRDDVPEALKLLREHYDFIVLDTSPVLPVADALQVGQSVDAVLLSVLRGVSRLPALYAAQQRLGALGIPILGAVLAGDKAYSYGMTRKPWQTR